MRWTPRIATSGWLISGVTKRPPSLPALVTVKVEPRSSSRVSVPRARRRSQPLDLRRELVERGRIAVADDGHHETRIRLDGDPEVVPIEIDDLVAFESRVELGELLWGECRRLQRERHELREVDVREVAFLDEGDGRNLSVGSRQMLDDLPTHAAERDPAALRRPAAERPRARRLR